MSHFEFSLLMSRLHCKIENANHYLEELLIYMPNEIPQNVAKSLNKIF